MTKTSTTITKEERDRHHYHIKIKVNRAEFKLLMLCFEKEDIKWAGGQKATEYITDSFERSLKAGHGEFAIISYHLYDCCITAGTYVPSKEDEYVNSDQFLNELGFPIY